MLSLKITSHYHGDLKMGHSSINDLELATKIGVVILLIMEKEHKVFLNVVVSLTNEDS